MKAIRIHELGGPETLIYEDVPEPIPGPGEALVQVHAVGVNFADQLMRMGAYPPAGPPPLIPGLEASGVIVAAGPEADGAVVGKRVMGWMRNSYAELAVAKASSLLPIPAGLSYEEAAAVPVVFATAWHALVMLA